jgi:hypothetical protein
MDEIPVQIRDSDKNQDEIHMVLSAWLKSLKKHNFYAMMPMQTYFENYRPHVKNIVSNSEILLATATDDPNHIYGFLVYRFFGDVPILSYCYVKSAFRRFNLARTLISTVLARQPGGIDQGAIITHCFPWLEDVCKKNNLIYNPFFDLKLLGEKQAS